MKNKTGTERGLLSPPYGVRFPTGELQCALIQVAAGLSSVHMTVCLAHKEIKVKEETDTNSTGTHLSTFVYFHILGEYTSSSQKAHSPHPTPENCQVSGTSAIETQVACSLAADRNRSPKSVWCQGQGAKSSLPSGYQPLLLLSQGFMRTDCLQVP